MDTEFSIGDRVMFVGPATYNPWLVQGGISEVISVNHHGDRAFLDVRIGDFDDVRIEGSRSNPVATAHRPCLMGASAEYFARVPAASDAPFEVGQIVRCLEGLDEEDGVISDGPASIVTDEDYEVTDAYLGEDGETWFLAVRHTSGGPVTGGWYADRFKALEEDRPIEPETDADIYDAGYEDGADDVKTEIRAFIKARFAQHPVFADDRNAFDNGARYILESLAGELLGEAIRERVVVELVPEGEG